MATAGYRCRVHNEGLFDQLFAEDEAPRVDTPKSNRSGTPKSARSFFDAQHDKAFRPMSRGSAAQAPGREDLEEQRRRRYAQHRMQASRLQAEDNRKTRERVAVGKLRREERFQDCFSSLQAGKMLSDELGASVALQDAAERTKAQRQFEDWNENVYGKLQAQINSQLDRMDSRALNARKREEFQQFLTTTNSKGAIFRDIIIESEYDPLEPNRHCIKVDGRSLRDPCSRVVDKLREEGGALHGGPTPKDPKLRETLDVLHWGTGKIEATPHGFFAKIMADQNKPKDSQTSKTWNSSIPFDHYDVKKGRAVLDREFPKGKRTTPILENKPPPAGVESGAGEKGE